MNLLRGLRVSQFKEILEEMKTVYNYKDNLTKLGGCYDPRMGPETINRVEIYTVDGATGVEITMAKNIPEVIE